MRFWGNNGTSDIALIKAYAKGSDAAFETLYLRHKSKLFRFIVRQSHSRELAEEIAHYTWIAVIKQAASYRPKANFSTWLFRIAHNKLIDHWRKSGASTTSLVDELTEQLATPGNPAIEQLELTDLLESLKRLSADQRTALLLKIEGFSQLEIAHVTNSRQETVKSRLRYAKRHLKNSMELSA